CSIKNVQVLAKNIADNVSVSAPEGFTLSLSESEGYVSQLILPKSGESVQEYSIYIKCSPVIESILEGNVSFQSNGDELLAIPVRAMATSSIKVGTKVELTAQNNREIPQKPTLWQNYPNPFNPVTTIEFGVPVKSEASISIYNSIGKLVVELCHGEFQPGVFSVTWNAIGMPSGVYYCRLSNSGLTVFRKIILLK
ncbi:MAG: T9SS type A sorting domain-containing protein, partial [Ignavibacteria bacterium]|nr:T9SS type A sorting domain-containing protein [Ignavibacteria bacterium]